jgi:PIN domain nuclease of toxin-antitoxin system
MTRYLLDTHALLWAIADPARLSDEARRQISDGANEVYVSIASAWELCVKVAAGKLALSNYGALLGSAATFQAELETAGFQLLPISASHVFETQRLAMHHRDPFDRLLVAQALIEDLVLVTHDDALRPYPARLLMT